MHQTHSADARGYRFRYLSDGDTERTSDGNDTSISNDKEVSMDELEQSGTSSRPMPNPDVDQGGLSSSLDVHDLKSLPCVNGDFSERFPLFCSQNGCADDSSALHRAKSELLHYPDDPYSGVRTVLPRGPQLCVFSTKRPPCCVSKDGVVFCCARWCISVVQFSFCDVAFGRNRSLSLAWLTVLRLVLLFVFSQIWGVNPNCQRFAQVNPSIFNLQGLLPSWDKNSSQCPELQLNTSMSHITPDTGVYIPDLYFQSTSSPTMGVAGTIYLALLSEGLMNTYFVKWTVPVTWAAAVMFGGVATFQLCEGAKFCGTQCWTAEHKPVDLTDYEWLRLTPTLDVEVRTAHQLSPLTLVHLCSHFARDHAGSYEWAICRDSLAALWLSAVANLDQDPGKTRIESATGCDGRLRRAGITAEREPVQCVEDRAQPVLCSDELWSQCVPHGLEHVADGPSGGGCPARAARVCCARCRRIYFPEYLGALVRLPACADMAMGRMEA